jgi:hemoglobin-like flavoprotein
MTNEQIQVVKKTWKVFRGISPATVGDLFYSKLFTENPSLRKMFPTDMEQQYKKLIDMLNAIIIRLDKLEELTEEIAAMAKRHVEYGVRPAHYKLVGSALLWTLQKGLGNDWNEDVKEAWSSCYTILANVMMAA